MFSTLIIDKEIEDVILSSIWLSSHCDGFNVNFFQSQWSIIKDAIHAIWDFFFLKWPTSIGNEYYLLLHSSLRRRYTLETICLFMFVKWSKSLLIGSKLLSPILLIVANTISWKDNLSMRILHCGMSLYITITLRI